MSFTPRVAGCLLALLLSTGCAYSQAAGTGEPVPPAPPVDLGWRPVELQALDVRLDESRPELRQVGDALFRAGFVLRSSDPEFGGFSGLLIDGDHLVAVSDQGHWWRATLRHDEAGKLVGLTDSEMAPLADLDGTAVTSRERRDAEELVATEEGLIVAFEGNHRTHLYRAPGDPAPRLGPSPEAVADAPENGGMEALARLGDGSLLVVSEEQTDGAGNLLSWVGDDESGWRQLSVVTEEGFKATAATSLPNGDVLLLLRFYSPEIGVRVRMVRLPADELIAAAGTEGAPAVAGHEVARFQAPLSVDNFEALDVGVGHGGSVFAYLLADDNYRQEQRTLLFQLELP